MDGQDIYPEDGDCALCGIDLKTNEDAHKKICGHVLKGEICANRSTVGLVQSLLSVGSAVFQPAEHPSPCDSEEGSASPESSSSALKSSDEAHEQGSSTSKAWLRRIVS